MSVITANANGRIVSWVSRIGSDATGAATFGSQKAKRPVACVISDPNYNQRRTAESEGFGVQFMVTVESRIGIAAGDRLMLDYPGMAGKTFEVRRLSPKMKMGLGGNVCYLEEVAV